MPDAPVDNEPKTFTQEEVDRMVGRARGEAKRSAATELAEQLGCTVDEAKAKIAAVTAADDALKSEAQRALDAANEAKAEATRARAAADAERLAARVERKLAAAGVDPKTLTRATALVAVGPDADDAAIDAEIEALRADVPALFTPTADGTPPPAGVTPPRPPATHGGGTKTAAERAKERFAAKYPKSAA